MKHGYIQFGRVKVAAIGWRIEIPAPPDPLRIFRKSSKSYRRRTKIQQLGRSEPEVSALLVHVDGAEIAAKHDGEIIRWRAVMVGHDPKSFAGSGVLIRSEGVEGLARVTLRVSGPVAFDVPASAKPKRRAAAERRGR